MLLLHTIGDLRLESESGDVVSRRGKPLVLLVYLARHAPRPVPRAELATLLWGERGEARARQSLRQALLDLKRVLGDTLEVGQDAVGLHPGAVELDMIAFERELDAGEDGKALARVHGEFLAGADDRAEPALSLWIDGERAGLRRQLAISFERMLGDAERRGAWREAAAFARRWSESAPFDERPASRLVVALRMEGHPAQSAGVHAAFTSRLREEMGVEPSSAFLALADSPDTVAAPASATALRAENPFVGRDSAFAALSNGWRSAQGGASVVALVEGDAGMGVSRLCTEVARWVKQSGSPAAVLSVDARDALFTSQEERGGAYATARALFASLREASALGGVAPATLATLAGFVPGISDRFPRVAERRSTTAAEIADALSEAIHAIGEDGPLLVIVTGAAGADMESRALLGALARIRDAPMLFVIADRSSAIDADADLASLRDDRSVVHVRLGAFTVGDLAGLLDALAPMDGDDRDRLALRLHEDTGGVPLFVTAQLDAMATAGLLIQKSGGTWDVSPALEGRSLPTPARVRSAIDGVSRQLSPDARLVLDAAAVFGTAIADTDIARLTKLPRERVPAAVDMLMRARLARTVTGRAEQIEIAPPVLARAAYDALDAARRQALHADAAKLLGGLRWRPSSRSPLDRARARYHAQQSGAGGGRRRNVSRILGSVAALAVAIAAITAVIMRRNAHAPARARALAVFPFRVQGGTDLDFLRNGMVELLGTSLDGVAGLRTLDPRIVIAAEGALAHDVPLTTEVARNVAEQLGAASFVLGEAVGIQGRLQLSAALYEVRDASTPVARVRAEGRQDELFGVVDRLSAQLAVAQGASARDRFTQLAAVTTSSLDALKSYLEGRAAYRDDDMVAALPAFERAVAADSTFSLAWYGLASTASWMLQSGTERRAAARAVRTSGRLPERDRTLVEAFDAYSRGAADTAEMKASSVANAYDDLEAWVILGETLFHHNWKRGRSAVESRRAWERVLGSDSRYWPALQHLSEVAALEGKSEEADTLLRSYEKSVGADHMLPPSRAFHQFAFGTARDRDEFVGRMAADRGFWLTLSVWYVAVYGRDLEGARRIARPLTDPVRPPDQQEFGRLLLAHLALAGGKWREARAELAIARAHSPTGAAEQYALMSLAPFLTVTEAELRERREDLRQLTPTTSPLNNAMPWPNPNAAIHPLIRAYLIAMLSARLGDDASLNTAADELSKLPDPTGGIELARGFGFAIRAERARVSRSAGSAEKALAALDSSRRSTSFVSAWTSSFVSQAYERYARAELLHQLGRDSEALRWYGTFGENSPYDLVYLAPALYRQGQIEERLGNRARAAARYASFLALWKDCDPELRALTADAARRLALLATAAPPDAKH